MDGLKKSLLLLLLSPLLATSVVAADEGFLNSMGNSIGNSVGQLLQGAEPVTATIAEAFIELRTEPGRGYPVFYIAERGEQIEILKERTDWYKVRTRRGKEGWVFADELAQTLGLDGKLLGISLPNFDDYSKRRWEGGMMFGDFGGADVVSVYGSWHFTRNLSIEADIGQFFGEFSEGKYATLNLVHQPFPQWRLSPFVALGGGIVETNPKSTLVQAEDGSDNLLDVGVGVRYYLTRRFLVRAQYKNYVVLTSRDSHEKIDEWKLAFSAFF
ncbi:MAG: SH3 domain-containing protein [Spongiibacteraceae bacterium]